MHACACVRAFARARGSLRLRLRACEGSDGMGLPQRCGRRGVLLLHLKHSPR
jgi:hypothetical protein